MSNRTVSSFLDAYQDDKFYDMENAPLVSLREAHFIKTNIANGYFIDVIVPKFEVPHLFWDFMGYNKRLLIYLDLEPVLESVRNPQKYFKSKSF